MKAKSRAVTIAAPCTQNWEHMEQHEGHNFCKVCQKCVIDFTGYTNEAIWQVLAASKTGVCGRLSQTQLNQLNYALIVAPANRSWMKYLGVLAIGTSIFVQDVQGAQIKNKTEQININQQAPSKPTSPKIIYGYLFDINHKPLNKIKVTISNTKLAAVTDINGRYEIKLDKTLNLRNNLLIANNVNYHGEFELNILKEKQDNFILNKADMMIMGEIIITPMKSKN